MAWINETSRIDTWLFDVLSADVVVGPLVTTAPGAPRIFSEVAPPKAPTPHVIYNLQSSVDRMNAYDERYYVTTLWNVRAQLSGGSYADLAALADAIDNALNLRDGAVLSDCTIMYCYREQTFRLPIMADGQSYRQLGGIYRIAIQANP